jgi:hypothetical protein
MLKPEEATKLIRRFEQAIPKTAAASVRRRTVVAWMMRVPANPNDVSIPPRRSSGQQGITGAAVC